jgi:hypothetical protein
MAVENDFLVMATETTALVDTQENYAGSGYQENGFQPGITLPQQFNKGLRQGTTGMAVIAGLIVQQLNEAVLDDTINGDVSDLVTQFTNAVASLVPGAPPPQVITVGFSTTPAFVANAGNPDIAVFQITLTGNVSSSTLTNTTPGQILIFNVTQDGVGGRNFVAPTGVPMGVIDTTASQVNTQAFLVLSGGVIVALTPMMLEN